MRYCGNCGTLVTPGDSFCGNCGHAVQPATPAPEARPDRVQQTATEPVQQAVPAPAPSSAGAPGPQRAAGPVIPPPAANQTGVATTVSLPFDPARVARSVVVGNWVAAAAVALIALATAGVLSLILAFVAKPTDFGIDNSLTLVAVLMTGGFGADLTVTSNASAFDGGAHLGLFTLTVTIVTLFVTVFAYRRLTARYTGVGAAAGDAVRVGLLTAVPLTAIALIFRADNDDFGPSWMSDLATSHEDQMVNIGASAVGSFFMPLLLVTAVLWLSCLLRRDWLPGGLVRVYDWFAAPLWGVITVAALLPVAGAIGMASVLLFGGDNDTSDLNADEWATFIGLSIAYLANLGFAVMTLGSGGRMGAAGSATATVGGDTEHDSGGEWHRLAWFANDPDFNEPGLWVSVVVVPLVLLVACYVVARRSQHRDAVLGNLMRFAATMLVAVPILSRVASIHGGVNVKANGKDFIELLGDFEGKFTAHYFVGSSALETALFLSLYTLVAALLMAAATGAVDMDKLKGQAADLARQMQTSPAGAPDTNSESAQVPHGPNYGQPPAAPPATPSATPPAGPPPQGPPPQ